MRKQSFYTRLDEFKKKNSNATIGQAVREGVCTKEEVEQHFCTVRKKPIKRESNSLAYWFLFGLFMS